MLAFSCNSYGKPIVGEDDIDAFAEKYGVAFPVFSKLDIDWYRTMAADTNMDKSPYGFIKFLM